MNHQAFDIIDSQVIVTLAGNLQGKLAAQVRKTILSYIADGYYNFKVDFSQVNDINSTGLGMLVNVQKHANQHGGNIIIEGLHGSAQVAFNRTRLNKAFIILNNSQAAA